MIKRVPKLTDHWETFYGCRNWPDCDYTRSVLPDGRIEPEVYYLDDLRWIYEGELE